MGSFWLPAISFGHPPKKLNRKKWGQSTFSEVDGGAGKRYAPFCERRRRPGCLKGEEPMDSTHKNRVQASFGPHARAYTTSAVHARGTSLARLVQLVAPQGHERVLDIATGAGHTALAFAPHVAYVVGLDLTRPMLGEARWLAHQRGLGNVGFCQGDAEHLPFADASFAVVTCRIAPHHFPDVARALREMARVCAPGGRVALADNVMPEDTAAAAYINDFEALRDPSHHWAYSLSDWRQLLQAAGLILEAEEVLVKTMNFADWVARLAVSREVVEELRQRLFNAPAASRAYLRPRVEGQEAYFELTEGLFVARKAERSRAAAPGPRHRPE
ncbi:MAG: hypothetical protein KatS3mg131_3166 [Candidatus Tectimicrobiota bacterium]|nr:MAG: hypothetical protein KatS3mg131_3166 [Candidatus Tectomicrobia bacterium]